MCSTESVMPKGVEHCSTETTRRSGTIRSKRLKEPVTFQLVIGDPEDRMLGLLIQGEGYFARQGEPGVFCLRKEHRDSVTYDVTVDDLGGSCSCPGFQWKKPGRKACKHVVALTALLGEESGLEALQATVVTGYEVSFDGQEIVVR